MASFSQAEAAFRNAATEASSNRNDSEARAWSFLAEIVRDLDYRLGELADSVERLENVAR